MSKFIWRSLVLLPAVLGFSGFASLVDAAVTDKAVYAPPGYDTFVPPGVGKTYADPVFGTTIKRLSEAMNMTDNAGRGGLTSVGTEYSTASPFNSNNSRLILQHASYFGLYDGNGSYLRDLPFEVHASAEPRWSRSDPNVLYFVNANRLMKLDLGSGAMSLVHTFSEYGSISGLGESDISRDGNHFVFVYEISTDSKGGALDTAGHGFNDLYIAPNNSVAIGWLPNGSGRYSGVELFDRNMNFQRQLTHALGHMHLTRDTNGDDVLIWTNSADPAPLGSCQNGIVKVRLSDAHQTCLLELDWNLAVHITAPDGNGWAFVETYAPANPHPASGWTPYTNEILQVSLDGSQTQRLFHHRSRPFDSYVYQPKATVSRDGSKLVFTSNYNLQAILGYPSLYTDAYLVSLSGGSAPSQPSQPSQPQPSPTQPSAPNPTPAPPSSPSAPAQPAPTGAAYVEQDNPAVSYSGGPWSVNRHAMHSGGTAALAVDPGSRASFTFSGRGASWIAYKDEWSGIANVYVDGVLKGTVDTYGTPAQGQQAIYTVSGLSNGTHTLTIEVTGNRSSASGGAWIWIDAFAVAR